MTNPEPHMEAGSVSDQVKVSPSCPVKKCLHHPVFLPALAVFVAVLGVGLWLWHDHMMPTATVAPSSTTVVLQLEQRLTTLEQQIHGLDDRLGDVSNRVGKDAPVSIGTEIPGLQTAPAAPAPNQQELAHLQNDVTSLSSALADMQVEVKKTGKSATENQQTTQTNLAAALAFIQLRQTADAGKSFSRDLAAVRTVVAGNSDLQPLVTKLEPYATDGVSVPAALHEAFLDLEPKARIALDKATAQNIWQRLLANLSGLISIRPLHGDASVDAFVVIDTALVKGDLTAALDAVKTLPAEAQDVLKEWQSRLEARLMVDATLQAIADHLIAETSTTSSSPRQGEP